MDVRTALRQGAELLGSRLAAEVLLAHAMGCERVYFHAHPEQELREVEWLHYGRYLHERMKGKPPQYITRKQEFYGREFKVTPDVLIPRPETEQLVEVILKRNFQTLIDAGTGSGAIAITLALETNQGPAPGRRVVIATDISQSALKIAAENASRLSAPIQLIAADLLAPFANESADVIVSNPPYIAEVDRETLQPEVRDWEPAQALFAGPSGTEVYERLIPQAMRVLKPGGLLALEIGFGQSGKLKELTRDWHKLQIHEDLNGIPRVLVCEKP